MFLLDLTSFPSHRALLSPHLLIESLLHQPLFTLLDLSPSFPRHMWLIFLLFVLPLPPLSFSVLSSLPSFHFTLLFSCLLFPSAHLLPLSSSLPPCSTSPFSLPFYSHLPPFPFFSRLLVSIPHLLPPPQFKYRGHFLPISPGARRAPRFAARKKVPMWAAVSAVMSF